jgi:hypothetical protein
MSCLVASRGDCGLWGVTRGKEMSRRCLACRIERL